MSLVELHWNTITPSIREVLLTFSTTGFGEHFYLAGGTALALQLGYLQSVDVDFFSPDQDIPSIVSPFKEQGCKKTKSKTAENQNPDLQD